MWLLVGVKPSLGRGERRAGGLYHEPTRLGLALCLFIAATMPRASVVSMHSQPAEIMASTPAACALGKSARTQFAASFDPGGLFGSRPTPMRSRANPPAPSC